METQYNQSILLRIGNIIFFNIAKLTSYVFAVSIFSAGFAGIVSTVFALYYFEAVNVKISPQFLLFLKIAISTVWFLLIIQHGVFYKLGIKGWGKSILIVNKYISVDKTIHIQENLKEEELNELFSSLLSFPAYITKNLFVWVLGLILLAVIVGTILEGYSSVFLFSILTIGSIVLFNIFCLTLISSEVLTAGLREKIKMLMNSRNIIFTDEAKSTVRIKFIFFLLLLAVSLYLSIVVTYNNTDELEKVVSFAIIVIIVSNLFAYMIFKIIYNSLKQIENAAYDLASGGVGQIFPKSLDREFLTVALGMNEAAYTIQDYKHKMEEKVKQRTKELKEAYTELESKDRAIKLELELARNIQQGIIPENIPPWNGFNFATRYEPMGSVSGDYYDIFYFSKHIYILIADVSGHGVPAALITMTAKQAFSQVIKEDSSPSGIFKEVNKIITERVKTSDYLSAFLIKIDEKNKFSFANAAHPNPIHFVKSTGEYNLLDTDGMFIGAIEEASDSYEESNSRLHSGDRIYLYTDGLLEHKNIEGEEYGLKRLIEKLKNTYDLKIQDQIKEVFSELKSFIGSAPIKDDISMLVFELDPKWAQFAEIYNNGLKLIREKKWTESLEVFKDAKNILPSFISIEYQLALVSYNLNDFLSAKEYIESFILHKETDKRGLQLALLIYTRLNDESGINRINEKLVRN
jgi:sigma-B regulation protein RsbU (phosphoserine phosphatase)